MEWIRKNQIILASLLITSTVILVTELLYLSSIGEAIEIERWELGLFISPVVVFYACFAPLMYLSWFGNNKKGVLATPLKIFYWLVNISFIVIITAIYLTFVFNI